MLQKTSKQPPFQSPRDSFFTHQAEGVSQRASRPLGAPCAHICWQRQSWKNGALKVRCKIGTCKKEIMIGKSKSTKGLWTYLWNDCCFFMRCFSMLYEVKRHIFQWNLRVLRIRTLTHNAKIPIGTDSITTKSGRTIPTIACEFNLYA